ncbi:MAG TPA: hypothetical protein VMT51_15710 [Dongiaceae bacterium]|nr:hypothetical protein [Dongiaceae bacterium]
MTQGVQEQIGTIAAIEATFHLFEIGREMLCAESMPRFHDAALEKRESGFDSVGVNVPVNVLPFAMNDGLVILDSGLTHCDSVRIEVIREH